MDRRLELHQILKNILGSSNVYFQPPENIKLKYPCIIYERSSMHTRHANNSKYINKVRYGMQLISDTPENDKVNELLALPYCSYDRFYVVDGLNHDSFTIFY